MMSKIRHLCREISRVEWSGILFYEVKGSIRDTKKVEIHLKDILLMDKGNAGTTGFDWGEDVVTYKMEHEEAEDWVMGHIHSHHSMNVFFSGTDWSELEDNSPNFNIYLSLIVNNMMDMQAKIAFIGKDPMRNFTCLDEKGEKYILPIKTISDTMLVYDCKIICQEDAVPSDFKKRTKEISEKVKTPVVPDKSAVSLPLIAENRGSSAIRNPYSAAFGPLDYAEDSLWGDSWTASKKKKKKQADVNEEEAFFSYALRLGNDYTEDTIEDALEDIDNCFFNSETIIETIVRELGKNYVKFFEGQPEYQNHRTYIAVVERMLERLKSESEEIMNDEKHSGYNFLPDLINEIEEHIKDYHKNTSVKNKGGKVL